MKILGFLVILLCLLTPTFNASSALNWITYTAKDGTYEVRFPREPTVVDEFIVGSRDNEDNNFVVSISPIPTDINQSQTSKQMLETVIKALVLKKNVKLTETTYMVIKEEAVAADFEGFITAEKMFSGERVYKGRILLENKKFFILHTILIDRSKLSIEAYRRFIDFFQFLKLNP